MFLDLLVGKLEDLESVREGGLRRLCLSKVINNFLVGPSLLDILIVEVYYGVAIREAFSLDTVVEDDLLFAVGVYSLNLSVMRDDLVNNSCILGSLAVVLLRQHETEIFLLFVSFLIVVAFLNVLLLLLVVLVDLLRQIFLVIVVI